MICKSNSNGRLDFEQFKWVEKSPTFSIELPTICNHSTTWLSLSRACVHFLFFLFSLDAFHFILWNLLTNSRLFNSMNYTHWVASPLSISLYLLAYFRNVTSTFAASAARCIFMWPLLSLTLSCVLQWFLSARQLSVVYFYDHVTFSSFAFNSKDRLTASIRSSNEENKW